MSTCNRIYIVNYINNLSAKYTIFTIYKGYLQAH